MPDKPPGRIGIEEEIEKTYEDLTRRPVLVFLAGRREGVPAREVAAVEPASDGGKSLVVGDTWSSTSS